MDKIICAGKNYLDHAKEMQEGTPERPVLFLKPPSVLKVCSEWDQTLNLHLPNLEDEFHYECELVFQIKNNQLAAVTLGLDMTNRSLQKQAKLSAGPWTLGKVFKDAACIGPWLPIPPDLADLHFAFYVNDELKQKAQATDMRMSPDALLAYAAEYFPICDGDLLFTGTPAGVGRVQPGDRGRLCLNNQHYSVYYLHP
ncbi:MAG: fumarylacetoacetate hydrolase family protein [Gammaproteobacteria bacterium]|nr:fumarylacetoacetate hydrolase family protein [Gammaproteobacteria bacterium]